MKKLEVIITPNKEGHFTDIFLTIYVDDKVVDSDFCQVRSILIEDAKRLVKEMFKGQRFSGGRKFFINKKFM